MIPTLKCIHDHILYRQVVGLRFVPFTFLLYVEFHGVTHSSKVVTVYQRTTYLLRILPIYGGSIALLIVEVCHRV